MEISNNQAPATSNLISTKATYTAKIGAEYSSNPTKQVDNSEKPSSGSPLNQLLGGRQTSSDTVSPPTEMKKTYNAAAQPIQNAPAASTIDLIA
ncbi:MAG: hypothetical protein ACM3QW_06420 [Ignavibacteriales bacterium]